MITTRRAVQEEALLGVEADGADAEGRLVAIDDRAALIERRHERVEVRASPATTARALHVERCRRLGAGPGGARRGARARVVATVRAGGVEHGVLDRHARRRRRRRCDLRGDVTRRAARRDRGGHERAVVRDVQRATSSSARRGDRFRRPRRTSPPARGVDADHEHVGLAVVAGTSVRS